MGRIETIKEFLSDRGAQWVESDGVEMVDHFGDPEGEYESVVDGGLAAIERGERETLAIFGAEAVPWLQGLVTNDLLDLVDEGNGQRNAMVNTTGRFVGEARLLHLPELLFLDLEPKTLHGAGLFSHLKQHIILEDAELADRSEATWRLGIYGDQAASILEELTTWEHDLVDRPPFYGSWARWQGIDLIAQRVVWSEVLGFELSCATGDAAHLLEGLDEICDGLPFFGQRTFETLRIESGVPRFGRELYDRIIPLEAGFEDAISFEKGCYLGQEIIARLDTLGTPAKMLRRIVIDSDEVPPQETEFFPGDGGERAIGKVESATYSPQFEAPVALGFIKRGHNEIGGEVLVGEEGLTGRIEGILSL